ncbi:MAG: type II toxin-antitoxin system RelE/ParE family toxin [Defluviitaleaceae bacterium]|nr:type II toxin-antitoxin system RelE/ParE family toxin [Defluviitaleaceae bacterium]
MTPLYSKQASKFLDSQDDDTYNRIKSAVHKLPMGDVKKLQGSKGKYRLRVGSLRVIFKRIGQNMFYIEAIDNRGQVYK